MAKVLVVEDDALLQSFLTNALSNAQFDVHAAGDGFEAEIEIKNWHPDVVLLDLLLPNEDGFAVLRKIRSDSETLHTHVIALSNLSGEETIELVKKFGVTEYYAKANITPKEIVEKLKAMFP